MGPLGRSGKQDITGPPCMRGENEIKGDIGPPGIPGNKGEPGESISAPKVTISSASQLTVNETNTAALFCSATGNPAPELPWVKINGSLPGNRIKMTAWLGADGRGLLRGCWEIQMYGAKRPRTLLYRVS